MADAQRVVATCGLLAVATGSVNSLAKQKRLPSTRFLIGSGVAFLILSALAEAEPDVAKALSIAVLSTVLLGQGDGVLSYLNQHGEIDTSKDHGFTPLTTTLKDLPPTRINRSGLPGNPRAIAAVPGTIVIPNLR